MTNPDSYKLIFTDLINVYQENQAYDPKPEYLRVLDIANGWFLQVHHGCLAIIGLEENGLGAVTAPLRRSVVEHLVALKWLVHDGEAIIDPLKRNVDYGLKKIQSAIDKAGWSRLEEDKLEKIAKSAAKAERTMDHLLQFVARAHRVDAVHDIVAYLRETSYSHPSVESAGLFIPYIEGADGRDIDQYGFCCIYLFEAHLAFNELIVDSPWVDKLLALRERITGLSDAKGRD